jgi:hypothetical protein
LSTLSPIIPSVTVAGSTNIKTKIIEVEGERLSSLKPNANTLQGVSICLCHLAFSANLLME